MGGIATSGSPAAPLSRSGAIPEVEIEETGACIIKVSNVSLTLFPAPAGPFSRSGRYRSILM
jgi:hypothetical protein